MQSTRQTALCTCRIQGQLSTLFTTKVWQSRAERAERLIKVRIASRFPRTRWLTTQQGWHLRWSHQSLTSHSRRLGCLPSCPPRAMPLAARDASRHSFVSVRAWIDTSSYESRVPRVQGQCCTQGHGHGVMHHVHSESCVVTYCSTSVTYSDTPDLGISTYLYRFHSVHH